jgi:chromosome partitioning protein
MTSNRTAIIAVISQKGGVGKTTITAHSAATSAEVHKPLLPPGLTPATARLSDYMPQVLAISTDPQASLTRWLEKVEKKKTDEGVPMPIDYTQEHDRPEVLSELRRLGQYRRIWVDTPGWIDDPDRPDVDAERNKRILDAVLSVADFVIVPLEPEELAFEPTQRTIERILKPSAVPFLVVVSNWEPRDGTGDLDDTRARVLEKKWPLAESDIRHYKLHGKAPAAGLLAPDYTGSRTATEARKDYLKLNLEIAEHLNARGGGT